MMELLPDLTGCEPKLCLNVGDGHGVLRSSVESLGYSWLGLDTAKSDKISVLGDAH